MTKPETINYRTFRAEKEGLFDERIFGPTKNFECYCGKYKGIRYKGITCDKCGVEVIRKSVRRERMGHIKLAAPVAHAWYFRGVPSKLGLLLDISPRLLESVIYFSKYMVTSVDYAERTKAIAALEREMAEQLEVVKKESNAQEDEQKKAVQAEIDALDIADGERKELAKEELLLKSRRRIAVLNEEYLTAVAEIEATYNEVIATLEKIEERLVLSEDEYFDIMEHLALSQRLVWVRKRYVMCWNRLTLIRWRKSFVPRSRRARGRRRRSW